MQQQEEQTLHEISQNSVLNKFLDPPPTTPTTPGAPPAPSTPSQWRVDASHMVVPVPLPTKYELYCGVQLEELDEFLDKATITEEHFDLWLGYQGDKLFRCIDDVRHRYRTYLPYLQNNCPQDIIDIAKSIIYELKTYSDKYDLASIVMALAQNGGVCNVQKEIGLRMVYASMTDTILQHVESESIQTKVLILLKNLRETLSERAAEIILKARSYEMNSHYILTIRNKISDRIGLQKITDTSAYQVSSGENEFYDEFMKLYNVNEITKVISIALNEIPRKLDYFSALNFIEKHKPEDVDLYYFKHHFVFHMDTGNFTDAAVRFMLVEMGVFDFGL